MLFVGFRCSEPAKSISHLGSGAGRGDGARTDEARQYVLAALRAALAADDNASVSYEAFATAAEVSKQTICRWWPLKAAIHGEALVDGAELPVIDGLASDLTAWFTAVSGRTDGRAHR